MVASVVEVENVWFSYNGHPILRDVNLKIKKGEFLAILGPNGGGKTTLVKLILGILKPDRGTIRVFGKSPKEVASRIGYVPQDTSFKKDFPISAMDVVLMGRLGHAGSVRPYTKEDRILAEEALERMGMADYRDRRIGDLSGGQRQRIFIARALAANPEIMFMDEPTASVDVKGQEDLYALLKEMNKTMTIVVVTHELSILSSYIKSVACVNERLYFHDEAEITPEMFAKAYPCGVEMLAHGLPHRVLRYHEEEP
jgi:zinc transport system ATP-binding protein